MMACLGEIPFLPGLFPIRTGEFGEINLHRTSHTATGATQACPELPTLEKVPVLVRNGPFNHLSRREVRKYAAHGTTSRADAAFHTVVNLFLSNSHDLFHQTLASWLCSRPEEGPPLPGIPSPFSDKGFFPSFMSNWVKERISSANAPPSEAEIHFSRRRCSSTPSNLRIFQVSSMTSWHFTLPSR